MGTSDDEAPPLGFLFVRIAEAVDREFVAALVGLGLKPRDLRLLVLVDRPPTRNQRELARELGVDAGNLVGTLDALTDDGLIQRTLDPLNRRQRLVSLTPAGRRLLSRAQQATGDAERRVFAAIPASERPHYYDLTTAVHRALHSER